MPRHAVMIVGPVPPPYGGMAVQAQALAGLLRKDGIEVELVPTNPSLPTPLAQVNGLRTLAQGMVFLGRFCQGLPRVRVIHILAASYLYFFLRVVPAVLLGRLFGRRVILNYRGGAAPVFFSSWGGLVRPILRLVHVITVPSRFLERVMAKHGFDALIIPNLVTGDHSAGASSSDEGNQTRMRLDSRLTLATSTQRPVPRLLVTRNLEPMYNVKMALEAFRVVKESHSAARLDIVGSGRQEAELKSWVEENGLKDVFFYGAVPNEQISSFLRTADILLNPSNVDNMPISLLEAFAFGIPVISTRVGGIPDLVGEEEAALLVEPGNHLQMAEKINELVNEPEKAIRLTAYAKDLCKDFTWESVRSRLLEVYYPGGEKTGDKLTTQRIP